MKHLKEFTWQEFVMEMLEDLAILFVSGCVLFVLALYVLFIY